MDKQWSDTPITFNPVVFDKSFSTLEDVNLSGKVEAANFSANSATFNIVKKPVKGSIQFTDINNGLFLYTPHKNSNGIDTFYFTKSISGSTDIDTGMATVEIKPINDPPSIKNATDTVLEDQILKRHGNDGLKKYSIDPDGDELKFQLVDSTKHGKLSLENEGSFTYTPLPDFYGIDSFTYIVKDKEFKSNTAKYTIQILPVNDPPVLNNDTIFYQIFSNEKLLLNGNLEIFQNVTDIDNLYSELIINYDTSSINGSIIKEGTKTFYYPSPSHTGINLIKFNVADKTSVSKNGIISIRVISPISKNNYHDVKIYPNPSKGEFYIDDFVIDKVFIADINGRKIGDISFRKNGSKFYFNANHLKKGTYILYLLYHEKIIAIKKLIID